MAALSARLVFLTFIHPEPFTAQAELTCKAPVIAPFVDSWVAWSQSAAKKNMHNSFQNH